MKKIVLQFSLFLIGTNLFAQAPANYYDNATGSGYALKTQLYNIIKGHNTKSYDALKGLYRQNDSDNGFQDKYYEKDNSILDIYSENPTGTDPYNYTPGQKECGNYKYEGDCYNREHLIPQSVFSKASPMVSDPLHIWPTDGVVNGMRSNYPHGVVGTIDKTSQNGSKLGNNLNSGYSYGYSGTVFEPIDEFKGDIARAYFYFATRYEGNGIQNWKYAMFNGSKDKVFTDTFLKILITWHLNDPVSDREKDINNIVYRYQKNRNPYVDHPEFVEKVWGYNLGTGDFEYQKRDDISVYNKTTRSVIIKLENNAKSIQKISVFNFNGQLINEVQNSANQKEVEVNFKNPGVYIIKVVGSQMEINKRVVIK
ncbi:endonuclease [Empedobacter stercoris]|uniref:T9SS type A sorting domain-containing protein n=1 Tax=Empedobacter stercoris TaxID=1628248 RepID=A0ABX1WNT1_9FLAO|nr:endonuclease [Empedobacter stercoris]NOJ76325.1 T9SS type A sorting domain-containing protein [Empedobacter stercoris]